MPFARYLLNTLFVAVTVTFGHLLVASLAAYAFARLQFPGRDALFIVVLSTMIIPGEVTFMPLFMVIKTLGWIDQYAALIVPPCSALSVFFCYVSFFEIFPVIWKMPPGSTVAPYRVSIGTSSFRSARQRSLHWGCSCLWASGEAFCGRWWS